MSTAQVAPIFQYNFENVNGKLTDLSGNGFDITLPTSGFTPVNDPIMGSCLQFSGTNSLSIDNILSNVGLSTGFTMTAWVNLTQYGDTTNLLNLNGQTDNVNFQVGSGTPYYFYSGYKDHGYTSQKNLPLNDWKHIAISVDSSGDVKIYVSGKLTLPTKNVEASKKFFPGTDFKTTSASIGLEGFQGMMAWMTLYNGVLSGPEIKAEMMLGQSNRYFVSNRSFPMDFKLFSNDGGADSPIMFIDSAGLDQTLDFHLVNTGKKPLSIPIGNGAIDATDNYHFQLRFRPGILSEKYVKKHTTSGTGKNAVAAKPLLASTSWSTLLTKDAANNDVMSFLYIGSSAKSIDVGKEFVLQLDDINASATGGSKNTNVEFKYQGIDYGTSDYKIEGYRTQNISIVNHTGDKNIPLRAEIAGMASVMTYRKASGVTAPTSELMFHLVNTGTETLQLGTASSTDGATAFTLSVDVQAENEFMDWALFAQGEGTPKLVLDVIGVVGSFDANTGSIKLLSPLTEALDASTAIQIDGISDTVTVGTNGAKAGSNTIPVSTTATSMAIGALITPTTGQSAWSVRPDAAVPTVVDNQMQWTISNNSAVSFDAGKGLSFMLTGIECSLPAGSSTITIDYSNIPGHWDGAFELQVTKSPVSLSQEKVGINILNPEASLHILEKDGSIPIRIGENNASKKLPKPDSGLNYVITSLVPVDNTENLFYDPIIRAPNVDHTHCTINFLSLDNGNPSIQPLSLSADINTGTYVSNSGSYFYFLVQDYFHVYELSPDQTQLTFVTGPNNTTELGAPGANSTILGEVCYFEANATGQILRVNISNPQSIPDAFSQSLPSEINELIDFRASANYLYIIGTKHFYVLSRDSSSHPSPSGLKLEGSVPYTAKGTLQLYEDIACLVSDKAITLINIADPTNPIISKTIKTSNQQTSGGAIFYKNFIFISDQGSAGLYAYDLNKENPGDHPIHVSLGMDQNSFWNIGLCSNLIYLSQYSQYTLGPTGDYNSVQTKFIKLADLYDYLTDSYSYITSKSIGLDVSQLPDNASLSIPYPKDSSQTGLSIGSGYAGGPAAISIVVDESSAVDPVSIMSYGAQPAFVVKQTSSKGQPYRVGIGTDNPKAPLHVDSHIVDAIMEEFVTYRYGSISANQNIARVDTQTIPAKANMANISIRASHKIRASQFYAISDIRIKELITPSVEAADLATLLNLKVSEYQHIDFVGNGNTRKKGLIAQQVKEHFPQAVSAETTDFIPDIYAMATDCQWQPITKHLRISLEKPHDLKVGDTVRLIAEKGFEEKKVVAIPDQKSFVISDWEKPVEKLFVFGKEVHDFHTVDYDQVAMLGVSAIQALHEKSASQEERIDSLECENQSLRAALDELRQDLADFKTAFSQQYQN